MKILLDENVDHRIGKYLESEGHEVKLTHEEDLSSVDDSEIMDYCLENRFIVLTHDDDFLTIKEERESSPTIIFLPQRIRLREMKRRLGDLRKVSKTGEEIFP